MPLFSAPDTIQCQLTEEGRNLLARIKFGSTNMVFRQVGWQLGQGGYQVPNCVKIEPIVDTATTSVGYIEVLNNTFDAGDKIVLNGVDFEYTVIWNPGPTIPDTVLNILAAINDSSDPRVFNLIQAQVDPLNNHRLKFTSLVTGNVLGRKSSFPFLPAAVDTLGNIITIPAHGFPNFMRFQMSSTISLPSGILPATDYYVSYLTPDTFQVSSTLNTPTVVALGTTGAGTLSIIPNGNLYPINNNEVVGLGSTINFLVTPMSLATSMSLLYPAYPVPPTLGTFVLPNGALESPTPSSVSFVMQVPDGMVGLNAYGEIGVWVNVLASEHPLEVGREVLFAYGHFPILAKTDRTLLTFRVIINFG